MPKNTTNSPDKAPELVIARRRWVTKPGVLKLLARLEDSNKISRTLHIKPQAKVAHHAGSEIAAVLHSVPESETGLAIFMSDSSAIAIAPPFPIDKDSFVKGIDISPLTELLDRNIVVGVVLLRLGHYSVGVIHGEKLVTSKSGSRYVKNRHKQGGSSQRRFERSRERQIREIFDKTCKVIRTVFTPYNDRINYILLGGEKTTLKGLEDSCVYLTKPDAEVLKRRLAVERPGKKAMETIYSEVWKSHIYELEYFSSTTISSE